MTIVVTQHVPFEGPADIARWAFGSGHRLVLCRLWAGDQLPPADRVDGLVVMGGPMSIWETDVYPWLEYERRLIGRLIEDERPVLGVCLGAQQIAAVLGAPVFRGAQKEIGFFPVELHQEAWRELVSNRTQPPARATVFHWHGDTFTLPSGAVLLASSPVTPIQGFRLGVTTVALQFHLESTRESVTALARACGEEIGYGTYQVSRRRIVAQLTNQQRRYGGPCNTLLFSVLDRLFGG